MHLPIQKVEDTFLTNTCSTKSKLFKSTGHFIDLCEMRDSKSLNNYDDVIN